MARRKIQQWKTARFKQPKLLPPNLPVCSSTRTLLLINAFILVSLLNPFFKEEPRSFFQLFTTRINPSTQGFRYSLN